jgi:hypothetical protein
MRRLLPLMLIVVAATASAQAYKWKDASGTVHYSDTPPAQGTDYKNVKTSGSAAPLGPSAVAPATAASAGKPATPIADTAANRKAVCDNLTHNMSLLSGSDPLSVDDKSGQRVTMDDTRRRQELSTAQDQYKQYCSK